MLEFKPEDAPSESEILAVQREHLKPGDIASYTLTQDDIGLYRDQKNRIFVPDANYLRVRLCITAHQGLAGHRAVDTTSKWLLQHFTWPNIVKDIRQYGNFYRYSVPGCGSCHQLQIGNTL